MPPGIQLLLALYHTSILLGANVWIMTGYTDDRCIYIWEYNERGQKKNQHPIPSVLRNNIQDIFSGIGMKAVLGNTLNP